MHLIEDIADAAIPQGSLGRPSLFRHELDLLDLGRGTVENVGHAL